MEYLKTDSPFPRKIHFSQIWAKRAPKSLQNSFFFNFLKNIISFSWKWKLILEIKMKTNILIDISPRILYLTKILVLELWAKMLLANQIAVFFKM